MGNGVAVSSSHIVSAVPSSSGGRLLTVFSCSSMGSLPWEAALHELLQYESFPQAAVLHELLQCRSLPQSAVLQEQTVPARVPHGVISPASKPAPAWTPLAPQVSRSCQEPAPAWALHRVTAFFGCIHLLQRQVLHGLQVEICSTMDLHGLQGYSLPHHGLLHGLQENLCSGVWSTSSPSFTDAGVCRVASLTLSHCCLHLQLPGFLFPLLKDVIPEMLPPL